MRRVPRGQQVPVSCLCLGGALARWLNVLALVRAQRSAGKRQRRRACGAPIPSSLRLPPLPAAPVGVSNGAAGDDAGGGVDGEGGGVGGVDLDACRLEGGQVGVNQRAHAGATEGCLTRRWGRGGGVERVGAGVGLG